MASEGLPRCHCCKQWIRGMFVAGEYEWCLPCYAEKFGREALRLPDTMMPRGVPYT